MKKSLLAMLLCFALCLGLMIQTCTSLSQSLRRVEVEETVLMGDPNAAEGLILNERELILNTPMQWKVTYHPGETEKAETTVIYREKEYGYSTDSSWMDISTVTEVGFASSDWNTLRDFDNPYQMLWDTPEMQQALKTAEETGAATCSFHLADYLDQYPLDWNIQIPSTYYSSYDYHVLLEEDAKNQLQPYQKKLLEEYEQINDALQKHFPVPVHEEDILTLTLTKQEAGEYEADYSINREVGFYTTGAVTEQGCYLSLNPSGTETDISEIPGGLGIYRIPFDLMHNLSAFENREGDIVTESSMDVERLRIDRLSNVYSLEEGESVLIMEPASDKKGLVFITKDKENQLWLTVFDTKNNVPVQRLLLPRDGTYSPDSIVCEEDSIVILWEDTAVTVLSLEADTWAEQFTNVLFSVDSQEAEKLFHSLLSFAWDGKRLAVFCVNQSYAVPKDNLLTVVTADGVQFLASYRTSLSMPSAVDGERFTDYETGTYSVVSMYPYSGWAEFAGVRR